MGDLDDFFDFDHDDKLDVFEQDAELAAFSSIMDDEDEKENELRMAGLDPYDLKMMSKKERMEALEDAGLNPDDYK